MPPLNVAQQLQQARAHHEAGRLQQAEAGYSQILRQFPNHADALHLLGVLAGQSGRHDIAASLFQRAIAASPRNPDFHRNLAFSLQSQGDAAGAVKSFGQVTMLTPLNAEAHLQLGNAQWGANDFEAAVASYQKSVSIRPSHAEANCNLGSALMMLGRPDQAVVCYQRAISLEPNYLQAHAMLANGLVQLHQFDAAIAASERALKLTPNDPGVLNNLGNAQKGKGDLDAAITTYERALSLAPDFAEVLNNLGNIWAEKKEITKALACFEKAVQIAPQNPEFYFSLGTAQQDNKQLEEAIASYHRALQLRQDDPKIYFNLGSALREEQILKDQTNFDTAIAAFRRAIELKPDYWQAILNLGNCQLPGVESEEAFACFIKVIQLKPDGAEAYNNLGVLLNDQGHPDLALGNFRKAVGLKPDYTEAICNLGNAWKDKGESDRAMRCFENAMALKPNDGDVFGGMGGVHLQNGEVAKANQCYRKAIEINPKLGSIYDALLFTALYDPQTTPEDHFIDTQKWNLRYCEPLADLAKPLDNEPDPDRKLRIGYISPDFREHVVSKFVLPLMENHDLAQVEFFGYAEVKKPDAVTERMKSMAAGWHSTVGKTDDEVAEIIRQDKIDILVDLAGHTGSNRLPVLARKPGPVQATYLGYPATTGMSAIDYRITDLWADPPGMTEEFHSEKLVRLQGSNWCFEPSPDAPPVYPSPADQKGYVTFCSFNNFAKVNKVSLSYWARILAAVPNSRLLIKSKGVSASVPTKNIHTIMADHGVTENRLQLLDWMANSDHFSQFANVDIALDSYPYNGTTTTCEALWMGVPVVTLAGPSHVSRVGVSLMTNVGLTELIGETPDQFIKIAIDLAMNIPRIVEMRTNLRQMMQNSPLRDGPALARRMEQAYRKMWRTWCESKNRSDRATQE